jgi:hypothetical protein
VRIRTGFDIFLRHFRRLVVLEDEVAQLRINNRAPAPARENAVMAAFFRGEVALVTLRNAGAQFVRGIGLTVAGDVVQFAFDGE